MGRAYDNWIAAYVSHTRFSESPDAFHFWTAVSTVAGALRRRVYIDERYFQWTPNFYIVLVGPPGVAAKSTSIRSGMAILEKVPGVCLGPNSMTWQALTESLQNAQEIVTNPKTLEEEPMSCLSISVPELGTFLRPDDEELIDVLVDMWDGQKTIWRRKTKTQGDTVVHNPWLNVIACTTPAWLKANFPDVLIGGGLTSRMVFVFADQKRQLVAYPSQLVDAAHYRREQEHLLHDLIQISELSGEYRLTEDARRWGTEWYNLHWSSARQSHMSSDRFAGYFSRKQTHLHKLALVLSAAKRDDLVITETDLVEANGLITELEVDMAHVFSSIGVSQGAKISTEVLALIKNSREITLQDLWRQCFNTTAQKDFTDAVKSAVEAGYVRVRENKRPDGKLEKILTYIGPRVISPSSRPQSSETPDTSHSTAFANGPLSSLATDPSPPASAPDPATED